MGVDYCQSSEGAVVQTTAPFVFHGEMIQIWHQGTISHGRHLRQDIKGRHLRQDIKGQASEAGHQGQASEAGHQGQASEVRHLRTISQERHHRKYLKAL